MQSTTGPIQIHAGPAPAPTPTVVSSLSRLNVRNAQISKTLKERNKTRPLHRTTCPHCSRSIVLHAMPRHMRGRSCLLDWAEAQGVAIPGMRTTRAPSGGVWAPTSWIYLLANYAPLYRMHDAIRRAANDADFRNTVEATGRLGDGELPIALLIETAGERRKRLARERADKDEREARTAYRDLLKQKKALDKELKKLGSRVKYYDGKKPERDAQKADGIRTDRETVNDDIKAAGIIENPRRVEKQQIEAESEFDRALAWWTGGVESPLAEDDDAEA